MPIKDLAAMVLLASFWGASFLFMRIAAPAFGPVLMVEFRVLLAGLALLAYLQFVREPKTTPEQRKHLMFVAFFNAVLPFTLISAAELVMPASLAATLNATTPLFGAVLAVGWLKDPMTFKKALGLMLGIVGVALLVGLGPVPLSPVMWVAIAASLTAALFYAIAAIYTRTNLQGVPPTVSTLWIQLTAAVALLPAVPFTLPHEWPSATAMAAVTFLALVSTALGNVMYFRLIANVGPVKASMVTYLAPVFGMLWGALFLHESLSLGMGLGFLLVVASMGLVNAKPAGTPLTRSTNLEMPGLEPAPRT